jgi:hypothetical protein
MCPPSRRYRLGWAPGARALLHGCVRLRPRCPNYTMSRSKKKRSLRIEIESFRVRWNIFGIHGLKNLIIFVFLPEALQVEAMVGSSEDSKADTHCGVSKSSTPPVAAPPRLDSTVRIVVPKCPFPHPFCNKQNTLFLHFRTCSVRR